MREIFYKELKLFMYSTKSLILSAIAFILILFALSNGMQSVKKFNEEATLTNVTSREDAALNETYNDLAINGIIVAQSAPSLMILDHGVTNTAGRVGLIKASTAPLAFDGLSSKDPVLSIFGDIDVAFIVSHIIVLFSLLFSYDAISGEKENGTLKMLIVGGLSRTKVVFGKVVALALAVSVVFLIPFLAGLVVTTIFGSGSFTALDYLKITIYCAASISYILVFVIIGVLSSILCSKSNMSLLMVLVFWVAFISIVPRIAMDVAKEFSPSMPSSELRNKLLEFSQDTMNLSKRIQKEYYETHPTSVMDIQKSIGKATKYVSRKVNKIKREQENQLMDEYRRRREEMSSVAQLFSLVSPHSAFNLISQSITGTGPEFVDNFEKKMRLYQKAFIQFVENTTPDEEFDFNSLMSKGGYKIKVRDGLVAFEEIEGYQRDKLDLRGLMNFENIKIQLKMNVHNILLGFLSILLWAAGALVTAVISIQFYDVR